MPTPAEQLAQAEQLRFQLKWDEAIALLREVVARQQEDRASAAKAQARIGKYLLDKGKAEEARPELNLVLDAFGDVGEAVFWARVHLIDVMLAGNELTQAEAWATQLADDVTLSPQQRAWGQVKLAEVDLAQGFQDIALRKFSEVVGAVGGETAEPHNWARVRLAELATQNWSPDKALAIADAIVADHGVGRASDQQVVWALLWKGRALTNKGQSEAAVESLSMAHAVAHGRYPDLAYEGEMELGETYRKANKHEEALPHYQAAFSIASKAGLPESSLDRARLQVGSELRHLGMKERGLAWLRSGIEDPARLTGMDELLSRRAVSFMQPEEAESWLAFMADPTGQPDPLQAYVVNEFGRGVPSPTAASPAAVSRAKYWLGRLYVAEKAWPKAIAAFEEALAAADTDGARGQALTWLTISLNKQGDASAAMLTVEKAAEAWRSVIATTDRDGDAHYAIDMLTFSFEYNGWLNGMYDALERLVVELSVDSQPSRACFARFRLMDEYAEHGRPGRAVRLGEESFYLFCDRPFGYGHRHLCFRIGGLLRKLYEKAGDPAKAAAITSEMKSRWPRPDEEIP